VNKTTNSPWTAEIRVMCWLGKLPSVRILNELRPIESVVASIKLETIEEFNGCGGQRSLLSPTEAPQSNLTPKHPGLPC